MHDPLTGDPLTHEQILRLWSLSAEDQRSFFAPSRPRPEPWTSTWALLDDGARRRLAELREEDQQAVIRWLAGR